MPMQEPGLTTAESRKNPYSLLVALDHAGGSESFGDLYLDNGETYNTTESVEGGCNTVSACPCSLGLVQSPGEFLAAYACVITQSCALTSNCRLFLQLSVLFVCLFFGGHARRRGGEGERLSS